MCIARHTGLHKLEVRVICRQRGDVHVDAVTERENRGIIGRAIDESIDHLEANLCRPSRRVGFIDNIKVRDLPIAGRDSNGRDASMRRSICSTSSSRQSPYKWTEIRAIIGSGNHEIRNNKVCEVG